MIVTYVYKCMQSGYTLSISNERVTFIKKKLRQFYAVVPGIPLVLASLVVITVCCCSTHSTK